LPLILKKLHDSFTNKEVRIANLMRTLVPEFDSGKTKSINDGTIGFQVKEKGIEKEFLPQMVSDGTIRLLVLLIALLNQPQSTTDIH